MDKKDTFAILFILASIFSFLVITGTLTSGFHFADDHEVIRIKYDLQSKEVYEVSKKWIIEDLHIRFRPFYYFHRVVKTKLFGSDFFIWSIYTGLLACIAFIAFYFAMRNLKFTIWQSLLFLMISFIGQQMAVWWRLGPNETLGLVFLGLSFFFMSRVTLGGRSKLNNILFSVFLILSSLSKESFIIIIPGIIIFKIWNEKTLFNLSLKETLKRNAIVSLPLFIMMMELYLIVFYVGTNRIGYGGIDTGILATFSGILNNLKMLIKLYFPVFGLIFLVIIYLIWQREFNLKPFLLPGIFLFFIVVPNLILYAKSGMWERYLLPSTLGMAFFIVSIIRYFEDKFKWLGKLTVFLVFILFLPFFKTAFRYAVKFSEEGNEIKLLVEKVRNNYDNDSQILMVIDPVTFYEQSYSFKTYMEYEFGINLYGYAIKNNMNDEFSENLVRGWYSYFKGRTIEHMNSDPDLIVFLDKNLINNFFQTWDFANSDYDNILSESDLFAILYKQK